MSNLEALVLNAPFSFDLASDWIPPFQLEGISLSNSKLGPKFPEWLYTQHSLVYLEVPNSSISSINGDMFWRFVANITQLNISKNKITADLTNITLNSQLIFMDHNNFTGGLPHISANNNFSGTVPTKMPRAMEVMLLGSNQFEGNIPTQLCNLSSLIQLDLFQNKLSGPIPSCISGIPSMGGEQRTSHYPFEFNLYNKGQELDFAGNPTLCGAPLQINCTQESSNVDVSKQHAGSNDGAFETESLYLGMGVGFAVGFWGLWGSLFLNRTWRHVYIRFLNYVADQL
ncbi:hypothetical protein ACSQ67_011331 [Phaseolus vulgaris]